MTGPSPEEVDGSKSQGLSYTSFLGEAAGFLPPDIIAKIDSMDDLCHYLGNHVPLGNRAEAYDGLWKRIKSADPEFASFDNDHEELLRLRREKYALQVESDETALWINRNSRLPADSPAMAEKLRKLDELRKKIKSY